MSGYDEELFGIFRSWGMSEAAAKVAAYTGEESDAPGRAERRQPAAPPVGGTAPVRATAAQLRQTAAQLPAFPGYSNARLRETPHAARGASYSVNLHEVAPQRQPQHTAQHNMRRAIELRETRDAEAAFETELAEVFRGWGLSPEAAQIAARGRRG